MDIPLQEEWDNFTTLDQDGGLLLYPDITSDCDGVITEMIFPFATIPGVKWERDLSLDFLIWNSVAGKGHVISGNSRKVQVEVTTMMQTSDKVQGNVSITDMPLHKGDILQISIPRYGREDMRKHIPLLLRKYTDNTGCGSGRSSTIPVV